MSSQWYYMRDGQQHGPVSSAELRQLANSGQLSPDDLVWKEGASKWIPAGSVKGLFPAVTNEPPPSNTAGNSPPVADPPGTNDPGYAWPPPPLSAPPAADPWTTGEPPATWLPPRRSNFIVDFLVFRRMITPIFIQALFWIGVVICIIIGLYNIYDGIVPRVRIGLAGQLEKTHDPLQVFLGIVLLVIGPFLVRLYCEWLIIFFRINETLTDIKNILERSKK